MTPAIRLLEQQGVDHEVLSYDTDRATGAYGIDASRQLGLDAAVVFKTLVLETDRHVFVVGLVPVAARLDPKKIAAAVSAKKAFMAAPEHVERSTGYVIGGVSPLGQKKRLATVIDQSAAALDRLYVSAGRRGLEIGLAPADLRRLSGAVLADITRSV